MPLNPDGPEMIRCFLQRCTIYRFQLLRLNFADLVKLSLESEASYLCLGGGTHPTEMLSCHIYYWHIGNRAVQSVTQIVL